MKNKKKLSLDELQVKSFITNSDKLVGGIEFEGKKYMTYEVAPCKNYTKILCGPKSDTNLQCI